MKKYELTENYIIFNGKKLFQIKALISFGDVKPGDLGGYIEKESNLSHWDNAWVRGNATVCDNAVVYDNARICGDARIYTNKDYTCVSGFGSEYRTTTFFRLKDKDIGVKCGCFYGTLDQFRKKVKKTHNDNKYAKEYLMLADLMEYHFSNNEETNAYENSN